MQCPFYKGTGGNQALLDSIDLGILHCGFAESNESRKSTELPDTAPPYRDLGVIGIRKIGLEDIMAHFGRSTCQILGDYTNTFILQLNSICSICRITSGSYFQLIDLLGFHELNDFE